MENKMFRGLGVALITPFKNDKSIDFDALSRLIDFQIANGTDYIVILGTTAETPTLTEEEKAEVVCFAVNKINGRVPIVMGFGGNDTAKLVKKLNVTDFSGVDAILSVTPYYNKPTQEGLFQHFCAIADASPVPVILYNVPGRTGVNMTAETTIRIAKTCQNVVAIKEASGNMDQIKSIIDASPKGFYVISGDDGITTSVIEAGGIGVISVFGNVFPKQMSWLVDNALNGNAQHARNKMDESYNELFSLLFVDGNPAGVKSMLQLMGYIENELRLPLVPATKETYHKIQTAIQSFL